MTRATPPHRAGEMRCSSPEPEALRDVERRVVGAGFADAIRRPGGRARTVVASIHTDCGTLPHTTESGGVPERGSFELE